MQLVQACEPDAAAESYWQYSSASLVPRGSELVLQVTPEFVLPSSASSMDAAVPLADGAVLAWNSLGDGLVVGKRSSTEPERINVGAGTSTSPRPIRSLGMQKVAALDIKSASLLIIEAPEWKIQRPPYTLPFTPNDFCAVDDTTIALAGMYQGQRLHFVGLRSGHVASVDSVGTDRLSAILPARGHLSCNGPTGLIAFVPQLLGTFSAYDRQHERLAYLRLPGFREIPAMRYGDIVSLVQAPGEPYDYNIGLGCSDKMLCLLATARRSGGSEANSDSIMFQLIDVRRRTVRPVHFVHANNDDIGEIDRVYYVDPRRAILTVSGDKRPTVYRIDGSVVDERRRMR